ncbi:MAG: HlyD family efflux transporter periplasmic adaptor subunit [Spirochaetaceae bacterium]|jgi:multidrug efflux pump subunit AcrA (membrane-fusion protein)|nr:HlyD family efflux transporter periplasmic adaptor subunit [Spirochaetaceae bacterium]
MKKSVKRIVIPVCAAAVLLLALVLARRLKNASSGPDRTFTVRLETYENVIEVAGNVAAAQEQTLQAAGDGTVTAVYVAEGDVVEKGDLVLQLDDSEQRYNLEKHDFDMEQKRVSGSKREVALMGKQRDVLLQKIEDRNITAAFSGLIASFTAQTGDYLEAKDNVGVIVDRSYLHSTVEIAETDAPKLRTGQKVRFNFPAYEGGVVEGYVESFPAVGTVTNRGAAVVNAKIKIEDPPREILPNYSFTGRIEISPPVTVLLVERQAIGYENGKAYVERLGEGGRSERVFVGVEPYGTAFVSVTDGLDEGDVLKALQREPVSGRGGRSGQRQAASPAGAMPGAAGPRRF